jgi:uncharacterized protein YjiS (DUF1127 family)
MPIRAAERSHTVILVHIIRAYLDRLEAIRQLNSMDERGLSDIGVTREDIPFAVRYGKR